MSHIHIFIIDKNNDIIVPYTPPSIAHDYTHKIYITMINNNITHAFSLETVKNTSGEKQ